MKTENVTILDSQNILMINEDEEIGVNAVTDSKVVSNERLPKELRICVVDGDIVNSSVTVVEISDAPMVIDNSEIRSSISTNSIISTDAAA